MDDIKLHIKNLLTSNKTIENIKSIINTYKNFNHYICKILECNSFEEIYNKYNLNTNNFCKYCGNKTNFISFERGYSDICNNNDCKKKKLSNSIKQSHKTDNKDRYEKISNKLKFKKASLLNKEQILSLYPYLKENIDVETFSIFYNENKHKTTHITSAAKILWGCNNRKELYNKFYGIKYCEICGKEALFYEKGMRYKSTCSQKCSGKLSSSKRNKETYKLSEKSKEKRKINALSIYLNNNDINKEFWENNFINSKQLFDIDKCMEYHMMSRMTVFRKKCEFGIDNSNIQNKNVTQTEIFNFITDNYKGTILFNDRKAIKPYELDIYLPDINIAIEFNGLLSHSTGKHSISHYNTNYSNETPEYNKMLLCNNIGVRLFQINEDEWIDKNKKDIWKSMLLSNICKDNTKIYARNCILKEVSYNDSKKFLYDNHIQGFAISKYRYGLYFKNELVFLVTFGKPRFNKNYDFEIIRSCSKKYTTIIGGFSKILKYFIKKYNNSIITYANRRWSEGNVYYKSNFKLIEATSPGFYFLDNNLNIINRLNLQKHKLIHFKNFDKNKTANEILYEEGYRKIYDCGNLVFEYNL